MSGPNKPDKEKCKDEPERTSPGTLASNIQFGGMSPGGFPQIPQGGTSTSGNQSTIAGKSEQDPDGTLLRKLQTLNVPAGDPTPEAPTGGPPSGRGPETRRCHTCGKVGHIARSCPAKPRWVPRQQSSASEIGRSISDSYAQAAGALDAAKELIAEVPELEARIRQLSEQLEGKEDKAKKAKEEKEKEKTSVIVDRSVISGLSFSWREKNGDSPLTWGRALGLAAGVAVCNSALTYVSMVVPACSRLSRLPMMLLATPMLSEKMTGINFVRIGVNACLLGGIVAGIVVGADYLYSSWYGLRTFWARKDPIKWSVRFSAWGPKTELDKRPDYAKVVAVEHQALTAVFEYTREDGFWSPAVHSRLVSAEILAQVAHHSNMSHMLTEELCATKLDMACGKISTVNFSRYISHLTETNLVSETARLAYALRLAQNYRLKKDQLPFYKPSSC